MPGLCAQWDGEFAVHRGKAMQLFPWLRHEDRRMHKRSGSTILSPSLKSRRKSKLTLCTGGSLGWKVRGSLMQDFEKVAYELEPSTTGSPKIGEVKTSEGYHIIMVEGRK